MINELVKKEVLEKFKRHLDNSYILISVGDLRELIPDLIQFIEKKELNPGPEPPKLLSKTEIYKENEIITLDELELRLIKRALEKTNGNIDKMAQELGISKRNLYRKFEKHTELKKLNYGKNVLFSRIL